MRSRSLLVDCLPVGARRVDGRGVVLSVSLFSSISLSVSHCVLPVEALAMRRSNYR